MRGIGLSETGIRSPGALESRYLSLAGRVTVCLRKRRLSDVDRTSWIARMQESSSRPDPSRIDVAGAARAAALPAPAALMTIWGVLVIVLMTTPIRPYTVGLWAAGDLLLFGFLGGSVALVSRPWAAAIGIALGLAAAVTIQLFVLAGQALYQPVVAAAVDERTWTGAVAGALLVGVGAIALGYVVTRGSAGAVGALRHGGRSPTALWSVYLPSSRLLLGGLAVSLAAVLVAGLLVGGSVLATARSAYVPPVNERRSTSPSRPMGRSSRNPRRPLSATTTSSTARHRRRPTPSASSGRCREATWRPSSGTSCRRARVLLLGLLRATDRLTVPGTYAFVSLVKVHPPADPGQFEVLVQPISSARLFTATADPTPDIPSTAAGGDGGRYLTAPVIAALGIEFWAASGAVALAFAGVGRRGGPCVRCSLCGLSFVGRPCGADDVCHQSGAQPVLSRGCERLDDDPGRDEHEAMSVSRSDGAV